MRRVVPPAPRPPLPTALPTDSSGELRAPTGASPFVVDEEVPMPFPGLPDGGCPNGSSILDLDAGSGCAYRPDKPDAGMLRNGPWAEKHVSGAINSGQYVDGRRVGPWRVHDANGRLIGEMSYDDAGEPHGRSRMFDANGEVTRDRVFDHGSLHGLSITRLDDGSVLRIVYDHGHEMSQETVAPPARSP